MSGTYVKVGVAVIVILAASYALLSMFKKGYGGRSAEFESHWALFHDATGLVDKSNVQIAGLNAGEITRRGVTYRAFQSRTTSGMASCGGPLSEPTVYRSVAVSWG